MAGKRKTRRQETSTPLEAVTNAENIEATAINDPRVEERSQTVIELDAEIEVLKKRRLEMQQIMEATPGTSTAMPELSTSAINQSTTVPVDVMVTLLKQIRSDNKPLPKFSGDVLEWPAFIEEYERTTVEHQISDSVNRERLRKALSGEARLMVQDKIKSTCFLRDVIEELQRKYGGKANILKAAVARVDKINRLGENLKRIKRFVLDALSVQWMSKHCKVDGLEETLLIKMLDLTPSLIRLRWGDYQREIGNPETGNFDDFVNMLKRVERESNIDDLADEGDRRENDRYPSNARRNHRYEKASNNKEPYGNRGRQRDTSITPPRVLYSRRNEDSFNRRRNNSRSRRDDYNRRDVPNRRQYDVKQERDNGRYSNNQQNNSSTKRVMAIKDGPKEADQNTRCLLGCDENHSMLECPKFNKAKHTERCDLLKRHRLCLYCGGCNHIARDCPNVRKNL